MASVNCPPAERSVLSWRFLHRPNRIEGDSKIELVRIDRESSLYSECLAILELPWRQYVSTNDPRASFLFHRLFLSSGFKSCGFILGKFIERGSSFFVLSYTCARYVYLRPSKHRNENFLLLIFKINVYLKYRAINKRMYVVSFENVGVYRRLYASL